MEGTITKQRLRRNFLETSTSCIWKERLPSKVLVAASSRHSSYRYGKNDYQASPVAASSELLSLLHGKNDYQERAQSQLPQEPVSNRAMTPSNPSTQTA
ncbi:hypothetical protein O988_04773 [Pseudogymnoascus sp. VKM F-3808]|nr:hypothetical protein O988_04773 [Pseudogymnoascus sp. VKM F-3808]